MACVYKIMVGEELYIGSTGDLNRRRWQHKSNIKNLAIQTPLYTAIRDNDCKYDIELLYLLHDGEVKKEVEREYYDKFKPGLNMIRPHRTPAEFKEHRSSSIKARCECGSYIMKRHLARHRRDARKHLKFITNK